jgi:hypothetical protein
MRSIERTEALGWKGESQARRADNRESSAAILAEHGVAFERKNMGAHLVVSHAGHVVDFWPGTGKYIPRGVLRPGRGVFNLLKAIGAKT